MEIPVVMALTKQLESRLESIFMLHIVTRRNNE